MATLMLPSCHRFAAKVWSLTDPSPKQQTAEREDGSGRSRYVGPTTAPGESTADERFTPTR